MKWFEILQPWLDPKFHLITQPPPGYDGGDTAQREGSFALAMYILSKMGQATWTQFILAKHRYLDILEQLNDPNHPGFIRRWPDPAYWGGLSDRLSRDQSIPNVIAMGFLSRRALWAFFKAHLRRALLFTTNTRENGVMPQPNILTRWEKVRYFFGWRPSYPVYAWAPPDITFMDFWALYIRAFNAKLLYPLLLIFDLILVANSLIKVYSYGKNPRNNDDLNHINCLLQAELVMPTPWSRFAKWIYRRRPFPALQPGQSASNPAQACYLAYFRGANPGPHLEQVFEPINNAYFG